MRRMYSLLWLLPVVTACSTTTPYPSDWAASAPAESVCRQPAGLYANQAIRTTGENPLELKQVFFAGLLNGFEVTHLSFEPLADGSVRISPWVDQTMLQEEMVLKPVREGCSDKRWRLDDGWDVDGYMVATGLIWTGGLLVPAAAKGYFTLGLTTERELVVHATISMAGVFALVFPFRTRIADDWYLFSPYDTAEVKSAEFELPLEDAAEAYASETH